ncbi:hypothetical protein BDZ89DRAFT_1173789, partial [Hymenopellis radicata]
MRASCYHSFFVSSTPSMADEGFSLGAPPFMFLVKGGPIPDFYASVQNTLRHVAKVYQAGPEQKGHVAYRKYHFCVKLNELITEEFRRQMNILAADPYQRFDDPQPGSKGSIQRWQALRADSRKWRQEGGPGSLAQMKLDADAQAEKDGIFDRVSESPPPKPPPAIIDISSDESDDNLLRTFRRPRRVNVREQDKVIGSPPMKHSTNEQKRKRASSLTSLTSIASSQSHSPPHAESSVDHTRRALKSAPATSRRENKHPSTSSGHQRSHTPPADLSSGAMRQLDRPIRFKVMMKRERETLTPPCQKCKAAGVTCFVGVDAKKRAKNHHPACIRCAAYFTGCSDAQLVKESHKQRRSIHDGTYGIVCAG